MKVIIYLDTSINGPSLCYKGTIVGETDGTFTPIYINAYKKIRNVNNDRIFVMEEI